MKGYSQFGEDLKVAEILGITDKTAPGTILEIGAHGPTDMSNSRAFIELGWSAVLVEFTPMPVHALVQAYGYCDRVRVIQAAITPGPEHVKCFEITENAFSTSDSKNAERW